MEPTITQLAEQKQTKTILWFIGGTVAAVAFFYTQIIIPIQTIQMSVAQINVQLADSARKYDGVIAEQNRQAGEILLLKQKVK